MKKILMLPILAAFAVTPALAQSTPPNAESTPPNLKATGGSQGEQENVIKGAKESSEPGTPAGATSTPGATPPNLKATGGSQGEQDNLIKGAKESSEPGTPAGATKTDTLPPNKQATGSEGKDDNRLPNAVK